MVPPPTPKPTFKTEALVRTSSTIVSSRKEDVALKEVPLSRYRCVSCILEPKTNVGSTAAKAPVPRTNPNINETPTAPKSHTHPSHESDGRSRDGLTVVTLPRGRDVSDLHARLEDIIARYPRVVFAAHCAEHDWAVLLGGC
jgi:hypothetical protein